MTVSIQSVLANDSAGLDQLRAAEAEMVARIGKYTDILASGADNFRAAAIAGASGDDIATKHIAAERGREAAEGVLAELRQRIATIEQKAAAEELERQWRAVEARLEGRDALLDEAETLMLKAADLVKQSLQVVREAIRDSDALTPYEAGQLLDQARVLAREGTPVAAALAQRFFDQTGAWHGNLERWSDAAAKPGRISELFAGEKLNVLGRARLSLRPQLGADGWIVPDMYGKDAKQVHEFITKGGN